MKGNTQGSPVVVTHRSGIRFLMAARVGLVKRGKRARAASIILASSRVACLPPDEVEQTEESAYEEGVLEVPLLVGFPLQGHARLTSSTKMSSEQKGRCFQQTINQCLEVTLSLTKKKHKDTASLCMEWLLPSIDVFMSQ